MNETWKNGALELTLNNSWLAILEDARSVAGCTVGLVPKIYMVKTQERKH